VNRGLAQRNVIAGLIVGGIVAALFGLVFVLSIIYLA